MPDNGKIKDSTNIVIYERLACIKNDHPSGATGVIGCLLMTPLHSRETIC